MIPSIIHQIWLDAPINPVALPWMKKAQNAGMEYHLWTNDNVWPETGMSRRDFALYWNLEENNPVALSDVLRILLVNKYGGFYLDCDVELMGWLQGFKKNPFITNIIVQQRREREVRYVYNEFFGVEKGHPLLQQILAEMERRKKADEHFTERVGFLMFNRMVQFYKGNDVVLLTVKKSDKLLRHHFLNSWVMKHG